jgi:hypothetical protein
MLEKLNYLKIENRIFYTNYIKCATVYSWDVMDAQGITSQIAIHYSDGTEIRIDFKTKEQADEAFQQIWSQLEGN